MTNQMTIQDLREALKLAKQLTRYIELALRELEGSNLPLSALLPTEEEASKLPTHLGKGRTPEEMLKLGEAEFAIFGIPMAPSYTLQPEFVSVKSKEVLRFTTTPAHEFTASVENGEWIITRSGKLASRSL